jgi:hypothetical protein
VKARAVNAAAQVIAAAMEQGKATPAGLAIALDSACLLNSPEVAVELAALRARFAVSDHPVDEDPIAFALTEKANDVTPQVQKLRALLAGQREDVHDGPPHHTYRVGRDLPELGGAR